MNDREKNKRLNEEEINKGNIKLNSYPSIISIGLTTRCNLSCIMCSQSIMRGGDRFDMNDTMLHKLEPLLKLAIEIRWNENGELFTSSKASKYLDFISFISAPENVLSTNLLGITPYLDKIDACNFTRLNISIDASSEKNYETIRKGAKWKKLLTNLDKFHKLKQKSGTSFPRLVFTFIPMRLNINEMPEFVQFAHEHGADEIQYLKLAPAYTGWDQVPDPKLEKNMLLKASNIGKKLGITVKHTLFHLEETVHNTGPEKNESQQIQFTPIFPDNTLNTPFCTSPWTETVVEADGTVRPCCHIGTPFGNLNQQPFENIWNNELYQQLRQAALENDTCMCKDCPTACKAFIPPKSGPLSSKSLEQLHSLKNLDVDCHPPAHDKSRLQGELSPARFAFNTSWNLNQTINNSSPSSVHPNNFSKLVNKISNKIHSWLFPNMHEKLELLARKQKLILEYQTNFNAKISEYLNLLTDNLDTMLERQKLVNDKFTKHLTQQVNQSQTLENHLQTLLETLSFNLQHNAPLDKFYKLFHLFQYSYPSTPTNTNTKTNLSITIQITNSSLQPWPCDGDFPVKLAYSWLKDDSNIPRDAPRIQLPKNIHPNETFLIQINCTTPEEPGSYCLAWDLVREGIAWFHSYSGNFPQLPISISQM